VFRRCSCFVRGLLPLYSVVVLLLLGVFSLLSNLSRFEVLVGSFFSPRFGGGLTLRFRFLVVGLLFLRPVPLMPGSFRYWALAR
jgi:hypothetical protein